MANSHLAAKSWGLCPNPYTKGRQKVSSNDDVAVFIKATLISEGWGFTGERDAACTAASLAHSEAMGAEGAQSANGHLWYEHTERPGGAKGQDTEVWEKH